MRLLTVMLPPCSGPARARRQQPGGRLRAQEDGEGVVLMQLLVIESLWRCTCMLEQGPAIRPIALILLVLYADHQEGGGQRGGAGQAVGDPTARRPVAQYLP